MPAHRVYMQQLPSAGAGPVLIEGDEAHHAVRVKRLRSGEMVRLFDGRGRWILGEVTHAERAGRGCVLKVSPVRDGADPPGMPAVEVWAAVPRGDRLDWMIDGLSQVGAEQWIPLETTRSEGELRGKRAEKLERLTIEAAKQCGRTHLLGIGEPRGLEAAIEGPGAVFMADGSGEPLAPSGWGPGWGWGSPRARLLVGPEGGWTDDERAAARQRGATLVRLGPHVQRVEVAAVVGAAILLSAWRDRA